MLSTVYATFDNKKFRFDYAKKSFKSQLADFHMTEKEWKSVNSCNRRKLHIKFKNTEASTRSAYTVFNSVFNKFNFKPPRGNAPSN